MLLALLSLPLLLQGTPPNAQAAAQPAALEVLQQAWARQSAATGIRFTIDMRVVNGADEMQMTMQSRIEGQMARPAVGQVDIDARVLLSDGSGGPIPAVSLIGTGDGVYAAEHEMKTVARAGDDWSAAGLDFVEPLGAWAGSPAPKPEDARFLDATEGREGWTGISYTWQDAQRELWLDAEGVWRESHAVRAGDTEYHVVITSLERHEKVDARTWRGTLPEGYAEAVEQGLGDLEANLLEVGVAAPEVDFLDLDGTPVPLASLRGKTVLLNFWFYH